MKKAEVHNMRVIAISMAVVALLRSTGYAYTKQAIVNAITKAAHAFWAQRITIDHSSSSGTFYGYSGSQTVIDPVNPDDRWYISDMNI